MAASTTMKTVYLRHRWTLARIVLFIALSVGLAYGDPRDLSSAVVGNPGDAYLILSLLIWGGDRSLDLFSGYSSGPFFAGGSNAMFYSDTFMPLAIPFRILESLTGSAVVAFNVLYLLSWVLACEFTYRLALRCCTSRVAAVVGAVAFSFTTLRLAQAGHFQLAWGALVPLGFLLLFRLRERPTIGNGMLLGLVLITQFLTSAYHGLVLLVGIGSLVAISLIVDWRAKRLAERVPGYAALALTLLVVMIPINLSYAAASDSYTSRSVYPGYFRLRLFDLRSPDPTASLARSISLFDTDPSLGSSESYAYVGLFVLVFVPVFLVLLLTRRRELLPERRQALALASVAGVGAIGASIAVGRGPILSAPMPFYDIARILIPGVDSMLAIVRLFVFMQLALVLAATCALAWVLRLIPARRLRALVAGLLLLVVVADSRLDVTRAHVPTVHRRSVYAVMQGLDEGIAAELPIAPPDLGARPFLESTRMVLGSGDDLRLVNGYSGHSPADYERTVTLLNQFPAQEAIDELQRIGARYVVLHRAPLETGMQSVTDFVNSSGYAYLEAPELDAILAALPEGLVAGKFVADDGVVLVLR